VAYWPGDRDTPPRLVSGAGDKMIAIDAERGKPADGFGDGGYVDLKASVRGDVDGGFSLASPPAVYKNIIITGGNNGEQSPSFGLYGDIRGWDARSGKLLWSFHTVPRAGEPGVETWEGDSWKNRSGTNVWSFFTVDTERGLVYAPLGSPTSDYYGADRRGANLYGNSLVALDANNGSLKWYRQLVHHDLWDYDLPAAPTLVDVKRNGRTIPAVAEVTKMGLLFIFDRVTGEPIFGIEERRVPKSTVPGESTSPTQPFPVKPPPLARNMFDPEKDFYSLTPDHEAYCKELWKSNSMYTEGPYTPPGVDRTMVTFPSTVGGGNWNGLSYDASLGLVFTSVMNLGQVAKMVQGTARGGGATTWVRRSPWGGPVGRFWNPETKIPCSAPPFGELVAVDVNRGEIAWQVPIGVVPSLKEKGFANTGTLNIGGSIATASGLIFIGATIDCHFRAFDSRSGKQLWDGELPACAHSVPMTFLGKDGRQYVVVAAGGGSYLGAAPGSKIVAYALAATEPQGRQGRGGRGGAPQARTRKAVLAWADTRNGIAQHDSVSHALATIERLGYESGAFDTYIRTDSNIISKHPKMTDGKPASGGPSLDNVDAIFFLGHREIELDAQQRADLLSFVRDEGKGFVAAHTALTAFESWPEFGELLGGRYDGHPWNTASGTIINEDPSFPATKHFPPAFTVTDEFYQPKAFTRDKIKVLLRLDVSKMPPNAENHRTDGVFPLAWAKTYGKGRVFYSSLGHAPAAWDNPDVQRMYVEALKWAISDYH
jgi:quinoprotein glucose dehydrogenase